jgi:hypothetical protein
MPSHLEIWKSSGRELITLSGQRVTVGKASTNVVSSTDQKSQSSSSVLTALPITYEEPEPEKKSWF